MEVEAYTRIPPDEEPVSQLLGALPRVAAPADFTTRVRAGIARGRSLETGGYRLPLSIRYGVGLGIVLLAFGSAGWGWLYYTTALEIQPVAVVEPYSAKTESRVSPTIVGESVDKDAENVRSASNASEKPLPLRPSANETKTSRMAAAPPEASVDQAVNIARTVYPRGINPNIRSVTNSKDVIHGRQIAAKDVLAQLGAITTFAESGLRVDAVNAYSLAERAGVKAGDMIEAINDQPVVKDMVFSGSFSGKSLRVVRGGRKIIIALNSK
jgi:hypothetical protein